MCHCPGLTTSGFERSQPSSTFASRLSAQGIAILIGTLLGATGMMGLELELRPAYHFTRATGEMNDPNGLMTLPVPSTPGGEPGLEYHMYFQSNDPGQSVGSIWGHAVSLDLVHWRRMNRTGIKGSSGGGVALPLDARTRGNARTAAWNAAAVASVPMYPPEILPGVGLSVWHSDDNGLLDWKVYKNGSCQGSTPASVAGGLTGVICPAIVPDEIQAGYLGDNYVWADGDLFYTLSGSNRCPASKPWCGYGMPGTTPQALLFSSPNLVEWKFESVFWSGPSNGGPDGQAGGRIDTPDTFELEDGSQAFLWLTGGRTIWMRGNFDQDTLQFNEDSYGLVDSAGTGAFICQQSVTDLFGRRAQIGWINVAGAGWSGAQSLPRSIELSQKAQKLIFRPHPAVWTLHGSRAPSMAPVTIGIGKAYNLTSTLSELGGGTRQHIRIEFSFPKLVPRGGLTATIGLLGGHGKGGTSIVVTSTGMESPEEVCDQWKIVNNTDSANPAPGNGIIPIGNPIQMDPSIFGISGAEICRTKCCETNGCTAFTFTDPQPGPGGAHECWLKAGPGQLLPNSSSCNGHGIGGGHCWSGLVGRVLPPVPPPPRPPRVCTDASIKNNTDTSGGLVGGSPIPMNASLFGEAGAEACRALCCQTKGCARWTFTDPQPKSTAHICWLKDDSGAMIPSSGQLSCNEPGGHCWSGAVIVPPPPSPLTPALVYTPLALSIVGAGKPGVNLTDFSAEIDGGGSTVTAMVDIFLDGTVLEVFGNDGEASGVAINNRATTLDAAITVTGSGNLSVTATISAWDMTPSIEDDML